MEKNWWPYQILVIVVLNFRLFFNLSIAYLFLLHTLNFYKHMANKAHKGFNFQKKKK